KPMENPFQTKCGVVHDQDGWTPDNTILMGGIAGMVEVEWETKGNVILDVFQAETRLFRCGANRAGKETFWYDPYLGNVYVVTHGTGGASITVGCPKPNIEYSSHELYCGSGMAEFGVPCAVYPLFDNAGLVSFTALLQPETTMAVMQDGKVLQRAAGYEGEYTFDLDYDPSLGPVTVVADGSGTLVIDVGCPAAPEPEIVVAEYDCGGTYELPAYGDTTIYFNGKSGFYDFVLQLTTAVEIEIIGGASKVAYTESKRYKAYAYPVYTGILVKTRGGAASLTVDCPATKEHILYCGQRKAAANTTIFTMAPITTAGNVIVSSPISVAVYRDSNLVGVGTEVEFYYDGTPVEIHYITPEPSSEVQIGYVEVTCPEDGTLGCGESLAGKAGDTVSFSNTLAGIRNHIHRTFTFSSDGGVVFEWFKNDAVILVDTGVELLANADDVFYVKTTGTGTFNVSVTCRAPYVVGSETVEIYGTCPDGTFVDGIEGQTEFLSLRTDTTYSDGFVLQGPVIPQQTCREPTPFEPRVYYGVATFSNRNFTGGPIADEVTQEELDWGLSLTTAPNGTPYKHWSGLEEFAADVFKANVTPTNVHNTRFTVTVKPDEYPYIMWPAEMGDVELIDVAAGFVSTWEGILWRNDQFGNYE